MTGAATLAEATEEFIDDIAHDLPAVLATPARPARCDRQIASSVPIQRCSRRTAKLPPEFDFQAKSSVAQALGISEMIQPASEGKDKHTKFLGNPLGRKHVEALGAHIGKKLPAGTSPTAMIVVST